MPIESLADALPRLSQETVLVLHLMAVGAIGLFIGIPFVSFKGGAARVQGSFATNAVVVIALAAALGVIVFTETIIDSIYDIVILSGYQALGVILIALPAKIMSETGRNVDLVLGGCIATGLLFLFHPAF